MKSIVLSIAIAGMASTAIADTSRAIAVAPTPPTASDSNSNGGIVLLLVLGAVLLMNGGFNGGARAKTPDADASTDGVVLMRF